MKRSMDIRWAEVRVGIFVVAALLLLATGIFTVGERTQLFTPKTTVEVVLPNVQGLQVGAPVWLSGVVVGNVAGISFTRPDRSDLVSVALEIDSSVVARLGREAQIAIKSRGLLGEKYVDIVPGPEPGIPEEPISGTSPVSLDEVVGEAYSSFQRFGRVIDMLGESEGTLGRFLRDPALYDALLRLSRSLETLADSATQGEGTLAKMVNDPSLYRKMLELAGRGEEAASRLQILADSLQDPEGTLALLVRDPALYRQSLETMLQAQRTLTGLEDLLVRIGEGEGTAGKLVGEDDLHDRLLKTIEELDALVRDIRERPGRYVRFSLF